MADRLIEDPAFNYRVRLSRHGEVLRGEFWVEPGGGGLIEHLHPPVEERFEVREGQVTIRANGRKQQAGPGDRLTVEAGVRHTFQNTGQGIAHLLVEMEPALDMAQLFEDAAALARAGKWISVGRRGIPKGPRSLLALAEFLDRYHEIFVPTSPPRPLQRIAVPPLARLEGWRRRRATRKSSDGSLVPGRLPPGPRTPSLINGIRFAHDPLAYIRSFYRRYGPVAKSRFPGLGLMIYVAEPELVKQVFTGDSSVFHAGEANATVLEPAVGINSLLTLDDEPHMRQRKLLLPPFHGDNVKRWEETIREITERDMETWPVSKPFSLRAHTQRITLDVILRAVFGVRDDERFKRAQVLVDEFARRSHLIVLYRFMRRDLGPWSPWARFKRARAALDEFLYEEITLRREEADIADRDDVLSLLLQARDDDGRPMTDRELRDELVTVIGAGHETTATALAWAFERLLRNPDVLDRLERSLPEGDDYLDATIKETLRMRPVIADTARRLTREIELAGYRIPAGAMVMPAITALHFREDIYRQPDEFRPERFLEGAPESYAWIPFGGGVRRCIGASFAQFEMRVVIRAILERAELRAADPAPERPRIRNITTAPAKGCRVVLARPLRPAHPTERPGSEGAEAAV